MASTSSPSSLLQADAIVPIDLGDRSYDILIGGDLMKAESFAGLPIVGPDLGADRYLELMQVDKKAEGGQIRFVVIGPLGQASMQAAPENMVREVIAANVAKQA